MTHEGALHLDDILTRRTRISIETLDRGVDAAQEIADRIAGPLGWSPAHLDRKVEHCRMRVAAERQSGSRRSSRTTSPPTLPGLAPATFGSAPTTVGVLSRCLPQRPLVARQLTVEPGVTLLFALAECGPGRRAPGSGRCGGLLRTQVFSQRPSTAVEAGRGPGV